jgi:hypothetical protein
MEVVILNKIIWILSGRAIIFDRETGFTGINY